MGLSQLSRKTTTMITSLLVYSKESATRPVILM